MRFRSLPHLFAALLLPVASDAVRAQAPSNWTTIPLPANLVSGPDQIGTTVSLQTTTDVWFYSGITKEWTVVPVTSPSLVFQANDYLVVHDGNRIHGYSSHTGEVHTITTPSTSPTIMSGPRSSSWVTLVADGNRAWAFGAFHGRWESITLSQPNPTMVSSRLTGLLHDGSTVYGVSAHHGTFVPVAADPQAVPIVIGEAEVGTASSPGVFRAFSAQQNTWGVRSVPATATPFQEAEYALVHDGSQVWAFSGITGTFATYTATTAISGVQGSAGVAAFQDGSLAVCYGAGAGNFASMPTQGALFHLAYHFAIVDDVGTTFTPFSALHAAFGPALTGSFTLSSNDAIGFADARPGTSYAYSPILNTWSALPISSPLAVELVRDAIVLSHPSGYLALSARYGEWIGIPTTVAGNYVTSTRGSTFVALDGIGEIAHVFDARLNRWASTAAQGPLTVTMSRHTAMAHDGQTAFGFGQPSGEWYSLPLTAVPSHFRTSSSVGTAIHGTQLSVYAVHGTLSYTGRYPEFTQAINLGNTLRLHQVAPPGSQMALLIGLAPARIDYGPALGHLYIDPATMFSVPWGAPVGSNGLAELALPVPVDPNLRHVGLHFQNLVLPPAPAQPWLSSSVAPIIF